MNIQCFVMEPTSMCAVYLRVYESVPKHSEPCPFTKTYHDASHFLHDVEGKDTGTWDEKEGQPVYSSTHLQEHPDWPKNCKCGFSFSQAADKVYSPEALYLDIQTGEMFTRHQFKPGALYRSSWLEDSPQYCGEDGQSWTAILPNGTAWLIDGRASNCNKPDTLHKCWCRHGVAPLFNVDKVGNTCDAGAGSIVSGNYHGFLRSGHLTDA